MVLEIRMVKKLENILCATEQQEQIALVEWANLTKLADTDKKIGDYLFHIPNQGKRTLRIGYDFVKMGLKKGMPDLMFAWPILNKYQNYPGLFIEMKRRTKAQVTRWQEHMIEILSKAGYRCVVCYGWEEARDAILEYLE